MGSQQLSGNETNENPLAAVDPDVPAGRGSLVDRSRRVWTQREEEILLETMKELTAAGWKSDNGFRAGYLTRAKEAIKREFPKTDICVHPHIKFKISAWKKNYYSLMQILDRSGVGFNNDGNYKIDIDDEQWAQVVQVVLYILFWSYAHLYFSTTSQAFYYFAMAERHHYS
ncbi:uncharacterized protein LOC125220728 [Salvia hispanica]|uniref:uncharacterized protein LOC125220728 n=1 Tax=Salvia hispanica TaxID=49212 RepID=UPI0020092D87|nr:uncharacterized protein LOC125220728 [Salvia hispanica]